MDEPFYHNINIQPTGNFVRPGIRAEVRETDGDYEEVKHFVDTPITMKHNVAYSKQTAATTNTHTAAL